MVTLYSTPTCQPCKAAERAMAAAGVVYVKVDLTQDAGALADLKERTGSPVVHTPMFDHDGELKTIVDLPGIIRSEN